MNSIEHRNFWKMALLLAGRLSLSTFLLFLVVLSVYVKQMNPFLPLEVFFQSLDLKMLPLSMKAGRLVGETQS